MNRTPQEYGLDHTNFRVGQLESIDWCLQEHATGLLEAPTGSGKTSLARAVSTQQSVIALCRTKNLQSENYGLEYGADVLFGRSNYECMHPDAEDGTTCSECAYADKGMHKCPYSHQCTYLEAKAIAKGSPFCALNYAYYLTARWPKQEGAQVLFLDEAHQLSDITLDFSGCTITEKDLREWSLPMFPKITSSGKVLIKRSDPVQDATDWLVKAQQILRGHYQRLRSLKERKRLSRCERLGRKVSNTLDALRMCPQDWYISSGPTARKFRRERRPGFLCRPLTARHHFGSQFLNGHRTIAMSATIGDELAFCQELGISGHSFRAVPNQFKPEDRKVHILDAPKMSYRSTPEDYERQADVIAQAIKECDSEWSGLVHVTRKREAALVADRLARRGLQDRVWVMPGWDGVYTPTDTQVDEWNRRRQLVPNSICVSWALWEGYNGLQEKINIIAKVPFPSLGDDYEKARMNYSGGYYLQRTAYQLEQGWGRTRRGRACDYGDNNGFVAVADGNWVRIKGKLSKSTREAITET